MNAETGTGYPADIELLPEPDLRSPNCRMTCSPRSGGIGGYCTGAAAGWTATLRVPRSEPKRSRRIEIGLQEAVAHLARILAEPPRRLHERLARARWRVVLRRTLPLWFCLWP